MKISQHNTVANRRVILFIFLADSSDPVLHLSMIEGEASKQILRHLSFLISTTCYYT